MFAGHRPRWVAVAFAVWVAVIGVRLAQVMVVRRGHFLTRMKSEAWHVADVPAPRGRILDRAGVPLAWSTRHFRVTYRVSEDAAAAAEEIKQLRRELPDMPLPLPDLQPRQTLVLAVDPLPRHLAALSEASRELEALTVESFSQRHYHSHPLVRRRVGRVQTIEGRSYGVSGEEKRYDHLLRGTDGKYRVMVRRDDSWIPGTWETLRELRPGYDVYLNLRLSPDQRR